MIYEVFSNIPNGGVIFRRISEASKDVITSILGFVMVVTKYKLAYNWN